MTTTNLQIKIVNCESGEEITRNANAEELAQIAADQLIQAAKQAEAQAKATARAAILDRLGLTAEEAALLLS